MNKLYNWNDVLYRFFYQLYHDEKYIYELLRWGRSNVKRVAYYPFCMIRCRFLYRQILNHIIIICPLTPRTAQCITFHDDVIHTIIIILMFSRITIVRFTHYKLLFYCSADPNLCIIVVGTTRYLVNLDFLLVGKVFQMKKINAVVEELSVFTSISG